MKPLKVLGIGLIASVLVLGGGAAWLYASFDAKRIKQEISAAVEKRTGRALKIEGELTLALWPNVALKAGRTSLSERDGAQEFARVESASVAVALMPLLAKEIRVREVAIDGLAANIIKQRDGMLNIADLLGAPADQEAHPASGGRADEAAAKPAPSLDIAGIRITNARFDWRDEQAGSRLSLADLDLSSGAIRFANGAGSVETLALAARGKLDADAFTVKLETPRLVLDAGRADGNELTLSATLDGPARQLAVKLALAGVTGDATALKIEKLSLDADAKIAGAHALLNIAAPVALDLGKQSVDISGLAGQFELVHAKLPMKKLALPLAGAARADLAKQSASLQLNTKLDDSTIKAKLDVGKFAPLALAFDVDIDTLDLDRYLPQEKKQESGDGRIDLAALKGLNLRGAARIGQLTVAKVKVSDMHVRLEARNGRLDVAPLSANLYDGHVEGSLSADANGNRFAARQNLANVRIGPLLHDLAGQDTLEGRGTLALDIQTYGGTPDELKKSLAGTARIALADGALKGINIGQKLREVRGMLKGGKDVSVAGDAAQKTDFSELTASFRIAGGVARNDDLAAKSPLLRLAGAGAIDIGNNRLDYLLKTSVVATSQGQDGRDLDSLRGLTIPVRLTGPLEKPDWKIELSGLASEAAKAKVEEKKEELKEKAEDKLKGKLKGLFK